MSTENFLSSIIRSCTKEEFDKVIKAYLKYVLHLSQIIKSDGPGDGGNDIRILDDGNSKRQVQLTIQKSDTSKKLSSLEDKILTDCKKAYENHSALGSEAVLNFFYSQPLSNASRRRLEKLSRENYMIELRILDSDDIAEIAAQYEELKSCIIDLDPKLKESFNSSQSHDYSLVYDLVGFGNTADIKKDIVEAYVIQALFENESLSIDGIVSKCADKFHTKEGKSFFERLLNKIYSTRKELNYDKINKVYSLTEAKKAEVEKRLRQQQEDECLFERAIKDILAEHGQEKQYAIYVSCLKDLYTTNFSASFDVSGITDETSLNMLKRKAQENGIANVDSFITKLLQVCENNKYLQKVCASNVFGKKVSLDNLEQYAKNNKSIYIDTTIALYLLCYYYDPDLDYDLYYYRMAVTLYLFCKKHNLKLHIVDRYLWELQRNVSEALSLVPFSYCEFFGSLGSTRNVLYNHYLHLNNGDKDSISFDDYLSNYGFRNRQSREEIDAIIQSHLLRLGIETVRMKDYEKSIAVKSIEDYIDKHNRKKTAFAIDNDALMMEFLSDNDSAVHPLDPVFITWDKTFFEVREDYLNQKPYVHGWMQFVPNQFVDRYSLLSFSINEETITKEMLAIISDDLVKQTRTLADALSTIIDLNDKVGLKYTKKLAEMRESLISNIKDFSDFPQKEVTHSDLDDVVFDLIEHYRGNRGFEELFKHEGMIDAVMAIIDDAVQTYSVNHTIGNSVFSAMDELITSLNDAKQ